MKQHYSTKLLLIACIASLPLLSCNKEPYTPDYMNAGGYVIGGETCKANDADDYWLIDLTYYSYTPQIGDTLVLNSTTYTNVIKTKGLHANLKQVGMRVSLDFKTVTPNRVETTGCNVANPITYKLKELFIINQFEIR